jgi:cytochrome P450
MLSIMLNTTNPTTGEKLTHEEMVTQIMTQFSNGFNGPAITLAWTVYSLSLMPDIEDKVIQEVYSINGGDENHTLTLEDLNNFKYITQVLKEVLRLFPPLPATFRKTYKGIQFKSGF